MIPYLPYGIVDGRVNPMSDQTVRTDTLTIPMWIPRCGIPFRGNPTNATDYVDTRENKPKWIVKTESGCCKEIVEVNFKTG